MTVELIAEVLAQHQLSTTGNNRKPTRMRLCSCGWAIAYDLRNTDQAQASRRWAIQHQAEQVAEALTHGAPTLEGEAP